MKNPTPTILRTSAFGAVLFCSGLSYAQTPPAPDSTNTPSSSRLVTDDEMIVLSPFEVSGNSNVGYQATDTLAGTRIRTNLRDNGSSISVATKEFMRDIGATDNQSLLQFMPSTEVGGTSGNFGGMGDGASLNDTNARLAPNSTTRVRGLDTADNTRDFYMTDIPWDGYNTSRIDMQRGANSVLFGNGSGAGIINSAPDSATLGVNTNVVTVRVAKYGSYRASLNLNRDILPKELALRFAALYDKKYYQQDPAFNRDRRYYGALRYEPKFLKSENSHTTFKISYENGDIVANRPRTTTPTDMISPWFRTAAENMVSPTPYNAAGDTLLGVIQPMVYHGGYNPFTVNMTVAQRNTLAAGLLNNGISARQADSINAAGVHSNTNAEPWMSFGGNNNVYNDWQGGFAAIYNSPSASTISQFLNPGTQGYTIRNGLSSTGAVDRTITGLRLPTLDGILPFGAYASAAYGKNFTTATGTTVLTNGFAGQAAGIYRDKTISDSSIFDFYNKLIDGPNKREFSHFDVWNATLEQTFWHDQVGFQLAYDSQVYTSGQSNMLGGQPMIGIDIWQYLPVALPDANGVLQPVLNPNFGRPFIASSRGNYQKNTMKRDVMRATPYLKLNFKDLLKEDNLLTKILGSHSFNGLYESTEVRNKNISGPYNAFTPADTLTIFGSGNQITSANAKVTVLTYLGPSLAGASSLSGANIGNITAVQNGTTAPALVFNSTYLATAPAYGTVYTPPAVGLSPSAVGGAATTASENPANYVGWTQPTNITINNVDVNGLIATAASERRSKTRSSALVDEWTLLDKKLIVMGGLRKDTVRTYIPDAILNTPNLAITDNTPLSGNRVIDSTTGTVDWSAPFPYPSDIRPKDYYASDLLKTWSIVGHSPELINKHLPWGLRGSLFYSHSENFRPSTRINIFNEALPPQQGRTKDYGFMLSALDGRVSFKMTWYETQTTSVDLGDTQGNNLRTRIGDEIRNSILYGNAIQNHISALGYSQTNPFDPTGLYALTPVQHVDGSLITATSPATQADWVKTETDAQAAAANALANSLDKTAVLGTYGISTGFPLTANTTSLPNTYLSGLTITGDTLSKGKEFELFLHPTDNWNITLNAAKTFATRMHLASSVSQWVEARWALYNDSSVPANQSIGDIPWFGGNQSDLAGRVNTNGRSRLSRNAWQFYQQFHAQEGNAVPELRPWRLNIVNNYSFSRGWIKGAFVGASYRWQDRNIIGYGYTENTSRLSPSTPDLGYLDVNKPFYGPTEKAIDLWVGYNKKFKIVDWRIQLNVTNAGQKAHLVPINTNPDGSIGSWRIADGQGWQITNTFTF